MDAARLFAEHHASLFRYLSRLTGNPDVAADAAQEAFVKLLEKPPQPGETRAWLFRVGTNAARLAERTRGRRLRLLENRPERAPSATRPPLPTTRWTPPRPAAACARRWRSFPSATARCS
jgi:RNA polymerase sigma-70 factor (ECF subfamily)